MQSIPPGGTDWVKMIAVGSSLLFSLEKVLKLMKVIWWPPAKHHPGAGGGITVHNGEYEGLVNTLGRIEKRIDGLVARVKNLEQRLST